MDLIWDFLRTILKLYKKRKLVRKILELKKISKRILSIAFVCGIIISGKSFAIEFEASITDEYKKWMNLPEEQKLETLMPQTSYTEVPKNILEEYNFSTKVPNIISQLLTNNSNLENVAAQVLEPKYSLNEKVDLRVENQESTTECWAFSSLKALETNIALKTETRELQNFSERHMDYATTKTFTDGVNPIGYNRELGNGGLPIVAYSYLTNGTGAVLEEDMPFEDNEKKVSLSEINKNVDTVVTDYVQLPTIRKEYSTYGDGNTRTVKYTDSSGREYTEEELKAARNIIKEHLVTNGAISSITAANKTQYYDKSVAFHAKNYNCNSTNEKRDHAITIVGWDDNYSRENFRDGARPTSDGAYLVLNSYSEENFDKGYMYVSYEDYFIESEIYGVQSAKKVDYDKIYQQDFFGGVFQISSQSLDSAYYGTSFKRNTSEKEILNNIGISLSSYSKLEIYVNPTGTSMNVNDIIKVGETNDILAPGYHRININPIELNSEVFAIVIKQYSSEGEFSFRVEAKVNGTAYANVTTEDRSAFSPDGRNWEKLSDLAIRDVDMKTADVCIKGFTTRDSEPVTPPDEPDEPVTPPDEPDEPVTPPDEPDEPVTPPDEPDEPVTPPDEPDEPVTPPDEPDEPVTPPDEPDKPVNPENKFEVKNYKLDGKYIMNITHETSIIDFLKNINTNMEISFFSEDDKEIKKTDGIVKTGMKLKLSDGTMYNLIVRGDVNRDGRVTLTDISKLLLHYNETKGFEVTNEYSLKGCDLNLDGKVSLTDLSQIIRLYNSI